MNNDRIWKVSLFFLVTLAMLAMAACAPMTGAGETKVWIDVPLSGTELDASTVGWVNVQSHAASRSGIASVELSVNGRFYRSDNNPTPNEPLIHVRQPWHPSVPGTYILSVRAISNDGQTSQPDQVTVEVIGVAPTPTPTATSTEEPTEEPTEELTTTPTPCPDGYVLTQGKCVPIILTATDTATPTDTPTREPPTATFTSEPTSTYTPEPPTPTSTATPLADVQLSVDNDHIGAGQCTMVRWHVSNVQAYWVNGQPGAGDDGSFQTCPCYNETHHLRAIKLDGSEVNREVTIYVSGQCITPTPQDTTPPAAPSPIDPTGNKSFPCLLIPLTLQWSAVRDASGIDRYAVKLEKQVGTNNWQSVGSWESTKTSITVNIQSNWCGYNFRWRVRARDKAGNWGNWSVNAYFHVQKPIG